MCVLRISPSQTCWFWRSTSIKIIWIWQTAIVLAKTTENDVFQERFPLWIKFVRFVHISITSCSFWRGMSIKSTSVWRTAIVIAKNDPKWCFWGLSSAVIKFVCFVQIRIPTWVDWFSIVIQTFETCNEAVMAVKAYKHCQSAKTMEIYIVPTDWRISIWFSVFKVLNRWCENM